MTSRLTFAHIAGFCSLGLAFLACGEGSGTPSLTGGTAGIASGGMGASDGAGGFQVGSGGGTAGTGSTGSGGSGHGATSGSIVDDVEDGDTNVLEVDGRSGYWYSYSEDGTVTLDPTVTGQVGSAMGVVFDAVDSGWSGFGLNFKGQGGKEPYDASAYTGLSFWVRADAPLSMTIAVADVISDPDGDVCTECHDHWATTFDITTEWKQVTFHWSDLARGGWGSPKSDALIITQLLALAWNVEAPGTVSVFVDDVELIADGVASDNVTTEYMPPENMGGAPGDAPGGLDWIDGGPPSGPTPVQTHGQLHVAGGQLLDENDQPPMLQGQAIAWDNWWPQYHNADVVEWLRQDWCVDVVRPAMGIEPEGAYLDNPEASTTRMTEVVNAAIDSGIYVIVDWHAHDIHEEQAVAFFSMMAETYGDRPNIIYEIFNEPETEETWADIKAYADTVIAAIRVHDPNNVVIVGTPEWDQRIDLAAEDPITSDPNVVYAVHFYAGTHTAWLRTRVADALDAGMPIYVSEHGGSEADGMGANDYDEWAEWLSFLDENQVGWINWSIADKEGETVSLLRPGTPGTGGWTEEDLTRTGVHVRSLLRSYNCPND